MERINTAQRRAVEEADIEQFDRLEKEKQDLGQKQAEDPETVRQREAIIQENEWAKTPMLLQEAAFAIDAAMRSGVKLETPSEQFSYAKQVMEAKLSAFAKPVQAKPTPQRVDGGGLAPTRPSGGASDFEKLPADAKAAFKRFVGKGVYEDTKEARNEYAREYNAPKRRGRPPLGESSKHDAERRRKRSAANTGGRLGCNPDILDHQKFAYRWFNDEPGRLQSKTMNDDWDMFPRTVKKKTAPTLAT